MSRLGESAPRTASLEGTALRLRPAARRCREALQRGAAARRCGEAVWTLRRGGRAHPAARRGRLRRALSQTDHDQAVRGAVGHHCRINLCAHTTPLSAQIAQWHAHKALCGRRDPPLRGSAAPVRLAAQSERAESLPRRRPVRRRTRGGVGRLLIPACARSARTSRVRLLALSRTRAGSDGC